MNFNFPVEKVTEGLAEIIVPEMEAFKTKESDYAPSKAPVFFNPVMELNRDIAVVVLQTFQKTFDHVFFISEPLAGCGIRGIRFALEVNGISGIILNDINPVAYQMAQHNVNLNNLNRTIQTENLDANLFLILHATPYKKFDFVDLDPFGTPVPYLDSAIRAVRNGGMLAVTATDLAPLCGVYPKVALRKYGGLSLRTEYSNEIALRLLIGCLAAYTAKHDIGIKILFSHSSAHYVRAYVSQHYGAKKANHNIESLGFIAHCFNCFHRETSRVAIPFVSQRCVYCDGPLRIAGPLWLGSLSDENFCHFLEKTVLAMKLKNKNRLLRTITKIKAESGAPTTYFVNDRICDKLGITIPPLKEVIKSLILQGYGAFPTHFHNNGFKTDASARKVTEALIGFS